MVFIYTGSIIGYYASGYLADKLGRKKTVYIFASIYYGASLIFLMSFNVVTIFLSLFVINVSFAIFRLVGEILAVEFFQTSVRAIGSGWVWAFAALANSIGTLAMAGLVASLGSWGITFLLIGTIFLLSLGILTTFIPETKERVVDEIFSTEIEKKQLE